MKPNLPTAPTGSVTMNYADRFQQNDAVEFYDSQEYGRGSYSSFIWQLQRPVLKSILQDFRKNRAQPVSLLDFACGSGRVLADLELLADHAEGIDISENMVAAARAKCKKARLLVGDILADEKLLQKNYDFISSFRFFLNVEPEMRGKILRRLRSHLRTNGQLLMNIHGNSSSLRHPAIVWRKWRERTKPSDAMLNEMSPAETRQLLHENGFEIVRQFGFGVLPPTLHRTPLRKVAKVIDQALAGDHWWNNGSIDMLFLCRPS